MKKTLFALLACAAVMPAMAANWTVQSAKFLPYEKPITLADHTFYLYQDASGSETSVTANIADMTLSEFTSAAAWSCDFTNASTSRVIMDANDGPFVTTISTNEASAGELWGVCVYHGEGGNAAFMVGKRSGNTSVADSLGEFLVLSGATYTEFKPESPATPEPATATLSLMALAGLCARRRRK